MVVVVMVMMVMAMMMMMIMMMVMMMMMIIIIKNICVIAVQYGFQQSLYLGKLLILYFLRIIMLL